MKRQSATKRTVISFSIAFLTALAAISIQQFRQDNQTDLKNNLEAQVYPKKFITFVK